MFPFEILLYLNDTYACWFSFHELIVLLSNFILFSSALLNL
jgi:hypothetical protein